MPTTDADPTADPRPDLAPIERRNVGDVYAELRARLAACDEEERFTVAVETLGGNAADFRVTVARRTDQGGKASVWSGSLRDYDDARLARIAGPGRYTLTLRDARNRIVTNREVEIDAAAAHEWAGAPTPRPLGEPPAPLALTASDVARIVRETMREEQRPTLGGLDARTVLAALPAVAEVVKALRSDGLTIKDMLPLLRQDKTPVADLVGAMRDLQALAPSAAEPTDAALSQLVPLLAAALASTPAQGVAQAQPPSRRPAASPATTRQVPPPAPLVVTGPGGEHRTALVPTDTGLQRVDGHAAALALAGLDDPFSAVLAFHAAHGLDPSTTAAALADLAERRGAWPVKPTDTEAVVRWLRAAAPSLAEGDDQAIAEQVLAEVEDRRAENTTPHQEANDGDEEPYPDRDS